MANTLKIKRGTAATIPQGQLAEPLFTTDTYDLYIGKGSGGNQRIQNYIASGTSSQFLKGDGSLDSTTYQATSEKGQNNGYASLDSGGKVPIAQLPNSIIEYKGTWNASTNTPTLADGTGNTGDVYIVSVGGTQNLGSGSITFAAGDWVMYNGTIWEKSINSNAVASVNGQTGVVSIGVNDLDDATITSVSNGQLLQYNSTSGKWVNWTPNYQTQLTNPVTGTGTINQLAYFSATGSTITSSGNFNINDSIGTLYAPTIFATTEFVITGTSGDNNKIYLSGTDFTIRSTFDNLRLQGGINDSNKRQVNIYNGNTMAINVETTGVTTFYNIPALATASTAILVSDSGTLKYRTPAQILSDIGGQSQINGTGFVKASGTTISYDNNSYTKTDGSNASSGVVWGITAANWGVIGGAYAANFSSVINSGLLYVIGTDNGSTAKPFSSTALKSFIGSQDQLNGTGFVKASGTTITYDNSTYLTTSSASSTYMPLSGGNFTGDITMKQSAATNISDFTQKASFGVKFNGNYWNSATGSTELYTGQIFGIPNTSNVNPAPSTRIVIQAGTTDTIYALSTGVVRLPQYTTNGFVKFSNSDGTLVVDTVSYLPLTGGTLTGALNGTSGSFSSTLSATAFIPTGSSVPTNGMYLPSANTVAISANSTKVIQISDSGRMSIGATIPTTDTLTVHGAITTTNGGSITAAGMLSCGSTLNAGLNIIAQDTISGRAFIPSGSTAPVTGMYLPSSGAIGFSTSTTPRMTITSGGNVGIGTASISTVADQTALEIAATSYGTLRVSSGSGAVAGEFLTNSPGSEVIVRAKTNHALRFDTNSTEKMRITSGGNVEVTTTTFAQVKINNAATTGSNRGTSFEVNSTTNAGTTFLGQLNAVSNNANAPYSSTDGIYLMSRTSGFPIVFTTNNGGTEAPRMTITSGGDVGIGNTAFSSTRLTVTGKSTTSSDFSFVANNSANTNLFLVRNDGTHIFQQGGGTESMRITNAGRVGINQNSPNTTLDVNGTIQGSIFTASRQYHGTKVLVYGPTSSETINIVTQFPDVLLVSGNTWAVFGRCNFFSSTGAIEVREFYIGRTTGGTWSTAQYGPTSNTAASLQSVTGSGSSITINTNSGTYFTVELTVMIR